MGFAGWLGSVLWCFLGVTMEYFILGVVLFMLFSGGSFLAGKSAEEDLDNVLEVKEEEPKELSVLDRVKEFFIGKKEDSYIDAK